MLAPSCRRARCYARPVVDDSEQKKRSEEQTKGSEARETETEEDDPVETPFDHPLFLPVVLIGLSLWFFYDGFINQDPDMLEHLAFNRGGFAVLSAAAAWFGYRGWQEMRENASRSSETRDPDDDRPIG